MLLSWLDKKRQQILKAYHRVFGVCQRPYDDVRQWFSLPLGQKILQEQQQQIDEILADTYGRHVLQLAVVPGQHLYQARGGQCVLSVHPVAHKAQALHTVQSTFEQLPIATHEIDIALLHHVLDFSASPHHVLKEVARAVIPNGYVIIQGFNPWSLWRVYSPLACLFSAHAIHRRHHLRIARLKDWFTMLDLELLSCDFSDHKLPVQQRLPKTLLMLVRYCLPAMMGQSYTLVLRKQVSATLPMTRLWKPRQVSWHRPAVACAWRNDHRRQNRGDSDLLEDPKGSNNHEKS